MAQAAPPLPSGGQSPPRFMGRYELIGQLARGGMGSVYLGRHAGEAGFQRLFAIKVLHEHLADEERFIDMLRDEARLAARIHHPNVVAVVDMGMSDGCHYLVMQYVEGPSLATLWKRSAHRPIELLLEIAIDTLEGLHTAHVMADDDGNHLNLVHRDVSPQNILVGVDGVARITDFGIAKAESRISSTQPGMRKGKIQFMSPEQIREPEAVDARSDIWAMGVVLWSLLANKKLFKEDNDAATVSKLLNAPVVPPSTTDAVPPACLDAIVLRALERDPEQRFSSAREMADALRHCAYENGLVGSRQRVAQWVKTSFEEELKHRRDKIREVVNRPRIESLDHSRLTALPPLRSAVTSVAPDDSGIQVRTLEQALPPDSGVSDYDLAPAARRRARVLWATGAATVLGGIVLGLSLGGTSDADELAASPEKAMVAERSAAASGRTAGQATSPDPTGGRATGSAAERKPQDPSGAGQPEQRPASRPDRDPATRAAQARPVPAKRSSAAAVKKSALSKPARAESKAGAEALPRSAPGTSAGDESPKLRADPAPLETNPYVRR